MFRWFESRIDPFARRDIVMPPSALLSFYWHFVQPLWPVFALILFFDLLAAISEVLLLATFVADSISGAHLWPTVSMAQASSARLPLSLSRLRSDARSQAHRKP
jgi:hypothetical protein